MSIQNQLSNSVFGALRPYQVDALNKIHNYIISSSSKQALVKMPMGTGKTTVIAVTCSFLTNMQSSIIVTSSTAVKNQLIMDVREQVWTKMGVEDRPPMQVLEIMPSTFNVTQDSPTIYVSTIQALLGLKINKPEIFESLCRKVNFVLFDEGHREPAEDWQVIIREFRKKVILFTATPIRNDTNKFQIDPRYVSVYSFQEAQAADFIRAVNFEQFIRDPNQSPLELFANSIFERYQHYIEDQGCSEGEVKVLIRCGNADDIEELVDILREKTSVLGIHEQFTSKRHTCLTDQVPDNIRTSDVVFWVHQYKLIEGIDNYQFSILGIYESVSDPRALIQQIGRVIRQGVQHRNAIVFLWDDESHQVEWWQSYLDYERVTGLNPTEIIFKYEEYFNEIVSANPLTLYHKKKYLKRFILDAHAQIEDKLKKYQLPKKTRIFETALIITDTRALLNNLISKIGTELNEIDILLLDSFVVEDKQSACIIYSKYQNSSILASESFLEVTLGIMFFRVIGNKMFYYDSNQFVPLYIKKGWKRVSAVQLKKLFSNDSQLSSISIQNGSITFNSFDRMIVNSQDVSKMVPDVTDKFNLCTTLVGSRQSTKGNSSHRRYVGFTNARISQDSHSVSLTSYLTWLDEINAAMADPRHQDHEIFNRFAPATDIPSSTIPATILFNFYEEEDLFTHYGTPTELDLNFYMINNDKFSLSWDGKEFEIEIHFDNNAGKYILQYANLEQNPNLYYNGDKKYKLIDWLNDEQAFQIILKGNEYRYFKGIFYRVGVPADYSWLTQFLKEFEVVLPSGTKKLTEKGKARSTVRSTMWDSNSLFYLVANKGTNIRNNPELQALLSDAEFVICTDLQTEIADFVTLSETTKTICFYHCKAGNSKLSATAFQEVCGQIQKNLDFVIPSSERKPPNITHWDREWKHKSYKAIVQRKIHNPGDLMAEDIWNKIKILQKDPESKTYVVALIGDSFSLKKYELEKSKLLRRQKPEIIQIDYILNQTALAVQRAQAKFLVAFNKL